MLTSRRQFLALAAAGAVAASDAYADPDPATSPWLERMAAAKLPGLSVAVLHSGRVAETHVFGMARDRIAVTTRTRFQAASISKPVTAIAAMILVQRGVLSLDEPVLQRLKRWRPSANRESWGSVTLRQLLSHSAGLTVHGFPGYPVGAALPSVAQILDGAKPANTPAVTATLPPGVWKYSGGGTTVAQLLMTDVTGRDFAELMDELVIRPLDLRDSSFRQPPRTDLRLAHGHDTEGAVVKGGFHVYPEQAAAGLWTTPGDLCRIAASLMPGGAMREPARLMLEPQPGLEPPSGAMGLGFMLGAPGEPRSFTHNGANEGFRSMLLALPEPGQGVVAMWNGESRNRIAADFVRAIANRDQWPDKAFAKMLTPPARR